MVDSQGASAVPSWVSTTVFTDEFPELLTDLIELAVIELFNGSNKIQIQDKKIARKKIHDASTWVLFV